MYLPNVYPNPKGRTSFFVSDAQYKALTGTAQNFDFIDGYVGFAKHVNWQFSDGSGTTGAPFFKGVVEHEISHAMGRFDNAYNSALEQGPSFLTPLDFYKYDCNGPNLNPTRMITCFSLNGGEAHANMYQFNALFDTSDWDNRPGDSFNIFATSLTVMSPTDIILMEALGWDPIAVPEPSALIFFGSGLVFISFYRV